MNSKPRRTAALLAAISLAIAYRPALSQIASVSSRARSAPTTPASFEVATVKPLDPSIPGHHAISLSPTGRVDITSASLCGLIDLAYNVEDWQISDVHEWMWKQGFDVLAKPVETTPPTIYNTHNTNEHIADIRLRQMLQALLVDRFHLQFHTTTATGPVFLLEKSGKPIHLVPTPQPPPGSHRDMSFAWVGLESDHSWFMGNMSMAQFASSISHEFVRRRVIDRTGLEGQFDFPWKIISASPDSEQDNERDTFPLFVQAMGLKLTKSTGPVETFVIDHAEAPTAN